MNAMTVAAVSSVSSFFAAATGHLRLSLVAAASGPVLLLGQAQAPTPDDVGEFLKAFAEAVSSKNWPLVAALVVIAAVWLLRKYASQRLPWVTSDRGGAILVLATSAAGAVATALVGGAAFGLPLLVQAVAVAVSAAGGFSLVKKLGQPGPNRPTPEAPALPLVSPLEIANGQPPPAL